MTGDERMHPIHRISPEEKNMTEEDTTSRALGHEPRCRPRHEPRRDLAAVLGDLRAVDGAVYAAVAATPTPTLDAGLRRLSAAADKSKISFGIAALMAVGGGRARRAAFLGVGAVAAASASANLLGKRLVRRARPDREAARVSADRHVPMPTSASFPSGHTASAVAFATAVGVVVPPAAIPLGALACAVGYSRVHTGVHYPGDVAAGAVLGVASAAAVLALDALPFTTRMRLLKRLGSAVSSLT
ncbi:phosphatase PAP2 family protein [Streptomyces lateritius]|uniref:phosphatase PAP2 family protein n=1 Tax=Streptomyces lateritius TaxID=67313 RepID=UPI001982780F|nr:phosphatase PAP2 family protein [Streptomyces lateritius]GGT86197.1 phosphatase PAP2 family protein [Streptomyces lateritius]